jgi:hypothetical protein
VATVVEGVAVFSHSRSGNELDWLAIDIHGHVGLFSTGGHGPVPRSVLPHLTAVDSAVDDLPSLPVVGECSEKPVGPGNFSFWIEPSRRGIYGFDWGPVREGGFSRLTTPAAPITVDSISNLAIRTAALLVTIPVAFEEARNLSAASLGVALYGGSD